jgi:murein L,D-transpeptidase YcbB/YkuD
VVVNVPEFRLRGYGADYRPELEMKVAVGRAPRNPTPLFAGRIQHVIFRPYWNVPFSIQRAELVPDIKRDRSYLAKNNYEVVSPAGEVVIQDEVSDETLELLRTGKLWLRQTPGPKNALGLVKFVFPNFQNVYMHDTPSKAVFGRASRDVSHGCIRVEKPGDLAAWVLRFDTSWPRERIADAMNGAETIQVNLKQPIPVLIVYETAVALESGEVRFFKDIYEYDSALESKLAASERYGAATSAGSAPRPRE